ncbi:MAG: Rpp14/Pop5 family protein [Candidatus Hydrothermarchaeaceae archaeon]
MRIKRLPPTLRERKRYVAFTVGCDDRLRRDEIVKLILREAMGFFGEKSMSGMNLRVLDFDEDSQEGFLVCHHKSVGDVKVSLALVHNIDGRRVSIVPIGVSGTLRSLKRKFLGKRRKTFDDVDGRVDIFGGLGLARRRGGYLDAVPIGQELAERVKNLNVKYVGLMEDEKYLSQRK